jgi:hypothetical protein
MDLFETEWDIAYRTGKEVERERIIKLIKDGVGWNNNDRCDCQLCANRRAIEQVKVERLIKQIKGEQK